MKKKLILFSSLIINFKLLPSTNIEMSPLTSTLTEAEAAKLKTKIINGTLDQNDKTNLESLKKKDKDNYEKLLKEVKLEQNKIKAAKEAADKAAKEKARIKTSAEIKRENDLALTQEINRLSSTSKVITAKPEITQEELKGLIENIKQIKSLMINKTVSAGSKSVLLDLSPKILIAIERELISSFTKKLSEVKNINISSQNSVLQSFKEVALVGSNLDAIKAKLKKVLDPSIEISSLPEDSFKKLQEKIKDLYNQRIIDLHTEAGIQVVKIILKQKTTAIAYNEALLKKAQEEQAKEMAIQAEAEVKRQQDVAAKLKASQEAAKLQEQKERTIEMQAIDK